MSDDDQARFFQIELEPHGRVSITHELLRVLIIRGRIVGRALLDFICPR